MVPPVGQGLPAARDMISGLYAVSGHSLALVALLPSLAESGGMMVSVSGTVDLTLLVLGLSDKGQST